MRNNLMKNILVLFFVPFLLTSCSKDNSVEFVPYIGHPLNDTTWATNVPMDASAYRLSQEFSYTPLVDSFNASSTSVVKFSNSVEVTIPSGSCVFANGNAVSGNVKIELLVLNKKGDYMRFARPTTSYSSILESAGSFYINTSQNGSEVLLRSNKRAIINFIDSSPVNNMLVFYGQHNPVPPLPIGTNPLFTWMKATDSSRVTTFTRVNTSGVVKGYNLFSGKFDWITCERFRDTSMPRTKITTLLPANYTNTNTTTYAVFKHSNTIVQLLGDPESRTFFAAGIPINEEILLVSISLRGTEFYLGTKEIVSSDNMVVSMTPELKTKSEIEFALDNL